MTTIPDDKLFENAERVKEKVVLITGAASGIGKESAIKYASYGAKVVIGDLNVPGAQETASEIEKAGGEAIYLKCDVTNYDDQLELFELAITRYGSVDIVIANAGVSEIGGFSRVALDSAGKPSKPSMTTVNINIVGVCYTAYLAQHYLPLNRPDDDSLKALIFLGSMASWQAIPGGCLYSASKHAVLGLMRSMQMVFSRKKIRVASVHPFFADTAIVPTAAKVILAGIPLTPVPRIAGAIFYASTDPDWSTTGSAWCLFDDSHVVYVPREQFKLGVYGMLDRRINGLQKAVAWPIFIVRLTRDLARIFKGPFKLAAFMGVAGLAFTYRGRIYGSA